MTPAGPELPPHLPTKRKHEQHADCRVEYSTALHRSSTSPGSEGSHKKPRIIGPSMPPAPLDERPSESPREGEASDSDDELGPAPPSAPGQIRSQVEEQQSRRLIAEAEAKAQESGKKSQREEWMLLPPKQDDWSSRVDPTKLRNRKFNTGKGAKAPSQKGNGVDTIWTETPEEKRKRLEDEVMGIKAPAHLDQRNKTNPRAEAEAKETERRIKEYNEKNRNSSLYDDHKQTVPKEKEDDPSKRAFDKEKDIGGVKINFTKRKEMLTRAADFGSRFEKGSYL